MADLDCYLHPGKSTTQDRTPEVYRPTDYLLSEKCLRLRPIQRARLTVEVADQGNRGTARRVRNGRHPADGQDTAMALHAPIAPTTGSRCAGVGDARREWDCRDASRQDPSR